MSLLLFFFQPYGVFEASSNTRYSFMCLFFLKYMFSRSSVFRPDLSEPPSPGHVATPAPPQPLALHVTPDLWIFTPDLPSVKPPDLTWKSCKSRGEKTNLPIMDGKRKRQICRRLLFFSVDGDIQPVASVSNQSPSSIYYQHLCFTPTDGPTLILMYSIFRSVHPPSNLGNFKWM